VFKSDLDSVLPNELDSQKRWWRFLNSLEEATLQLENFFLQRCCAVEAFLLTWYIKYIFTISW